jgi:hypothetical protein
MNEIEFAYQRSRYLHDQLTIAHGTLAAIKDQIDDPDIPNEEKLVYITVLLTQGPVVSPATLLYMPVAGRPC